MKSTRLSIAVSTLLFVAIALALPSQIRNGYAKSSWQLSEWLINYRGGFVRRGLPGEILWQLNDRWGVDPYLAVVSLTLAVYVVVIGYAIRAAWVGRLPWAFVPASMALGFPVFGQDWLRKDVLLLLLFALALKLVFVRSSVARIVGLNAVIVIAVLSHEAFIFFALPAIVWIGLRHRGVRSPIELAPSWMATFAVVLFHGSSELAQRVWTSWAGITFTGTNLAQGPANSTSPLAAVESLGWSATRGWEITKGALAATTHGVPVVLVWAVIVPLVIVTTIAILGPHFVAALASPDERLDRLSFLGLATAQFLVVLPLYIAGVDWGRWLFLWASSVGVILVVIPRPELATLAAPFGRFWLRGGAHTLGPRGQRLATLVQKVCGLRTVFTLVLLVLAIPPSLLNVDIVNYAPLVQLVNAVKN